MFSLSPEPPIPSPTLRLISDSQIANEIDRIERTRNYWWDEDSHCRFSLGGAQGKFTLSRVDGKWYWPDMMLPPPTSSNRSPMTFPRRPRWNWRRCDCRNCAASTHRHAARSRRSARRPISWNGSTVAWRKAESSDCGKRTSCKRWDCRPATNTIRRPMTGSPATHRCVGFPVLPVARKAGLQHVVRQQRRTCEELFPDPRSRMGDTPVSPV